MKTKRADHPAFHAAWENLQQQIGRVLSLAHDSQANRQDFDTAVAAAITDLEGLKELIPSPTLAVGQRVTVTLDNEHLGKTGTVLQLARGLARVALYPTDTVGRAFHITDIEPAE